MLNGLMAQTVPDKQIKSRETIGVSLKEANKMVEKDGKKIVVTKIAEKSIMDQTLPNRPPAKPNDSGGDSSGGDSASGSKASD